MTIPSISKTCPSQSAPTMQSDDRHAASLTERVAVVALATVILIAATSIVMAAGTEAALLLATATVIVLVAASATSSTSTQDETYHPPVFGRRIPSFLPIPPWIATHRVPVGNTRWLRPSGYEDHSSVALPSQRRHPEIPIPVYRTPVGRFASYEESNANRYSRPLVTPEPRGSRVPVGESWSTRSSDSLWNANSDNTSETLPLAHERKIPLTTSSYVGRTPVGERSAYR